MSPELDPDHPQLAETRAGWRFRGTLRPDFALPTRLGEESVWDYPRPPRIEADPRTVEVADGGTVLAKSTRALRVLETASPPTYYLPPDEVAMDRLHPLSDVSVCEWKGEARYFALTKDGSPVAWSYPRPFPEFAPLRDWIAFYPGRVECRLASEPVTPQPGGVYAGWITAGVIGPFKGDPGTEAW